MHRVMGIEGEGRVLFYKLVLFYRRLSNLPDACFSQLTKIQSSFRDIRGQKPESSIGSLRKAKTKNAEISLK